MTTLTWGNIPNFDKIGRQVEISKEVSSPGFRELFFPKGEIKTEAQDFLFRRIIAVSRALEDEILNNWDTLPEQSRNRLQALATAYFCKGESKSAKKPAKRTLTKSLSKAYVYMAAFYALVTDTLDDFYYDVSLLVEAHSSLMHTILDAADQADEPNMAAFLKFLEKDFEKGEPGNCILYTQEMSDRFNSLVEGVEVD